MDSINNVFSKKTFKSPLMKGIRTAVVLEFVMAWLKTQLGPVIDTHSRAVSLKQGLLTIACLHPTLASEIKFRETQLLAAINKEFGEKTVERIKFVV